MKKRFLGLMIAVIFMLPVFVNAEEGSVKIGETKYPTLKEAVEAIVDDTATTITVLESHETSGIVFESGRNITIDLGGFVVTFKGPTVGSEGTETNDMQILKDSTIVFKNGKFVSSDTEDSKMFIQNYANLTLKDVEIDATNELNQYAVSNNSGIVSIEGNTSIKATDVAFDVYGWYTFYPSGPQVTVDTTGAIEGKIEVTADKGTASKELSLVIKNANHIGEIYIQEGLENKVTIENGTYTDEVAKEIITPSEDSEVVEVVDSETGDIKYVVATEDDIVDVPYEEGIMTSDEFEEMLKFIEETEEDEIEEDAKEYFEETKKAIAELRKLLEGKNVISAHDIYYGSFIGDDYVSNSDKAELDKAVEVVLEIPTTLEKVKEGYTRKYFVVRVHETLDDEDNYKLEVKTLDAKDNGDGTVSFESDKFSTYVLAYEDVQNVDNPKTFDGISLYIILGGLSLIGIAFVSVILKKEQKN